MKADQIFVALDLDSEAQARALVAQLGDAAVAYKIGIAFLTAHGPGLARELVAAGKAVFLDLKLHEIPASVAAGVGAAGRLGVQAVTVHASAGSAVLRAAVEAARPFPQLKVLALTVITSLGDADMAEIGLAGTVAQQVERLARLAGEAGCHGVIASAEEAAQLKGLLPPEAWIVTPGVQLDDGRKTDQRRITTPAGAFAAGATHLIIGRGITASADPLESLQKLLGRAAGPASAARL